MVKKSEETTLFMKIMLEKHYKAIYMSGPW